VTRDTLRFAQKACEMVDEQGLSHPISKAPATDLSKSSKAGRQVVQANDDGTYRVTTEQQWKILREEPRDNLLNTVWHDGTLHRFELFDAVRERAELR
jgi:hypothetical protein